MELITNLSNSVQIKKVSESETEGVFEIEGLYTGYGLTVGNALRRVLLSSLPGAAITQFKIKGVGHEFTTVPNVTEDVVEIGLNLKKIRFKLFGDEPQIITLKVKGEKEVTSADIEGNSNVEVMTPDIHIATLTSKSAEFDLEIKIERGLGYVPVEARKFEKLPIGTIALDAFYSPVMRANFVFENMRVGDQTDYNRVKIEIRTDGTISPSSALQNAAVILKDHFEKITSIEVPAATSAEEEESEDAEGEGKPKKTSKKKKK